MESLRTLFKIGHGPSSSHTMGPYYACEEFLKRNISAERFVVELYGSLALTGKGHLTDKAILDVLGEYRTEIKFCPDINYDYHPNGMKLFAYSGEKKVDEWLVFSVGGGNLKNLNDDRSLSKKKGYPHQKMEDIIKYIKDNKMTLIDYIKTFDNNIFDYLNQVFDVMKSSVDTGLMKTANLPGSLNLERKANKFYKIYKDTNDYQTLLFANTLAVCEENASGGLIVTAHTCGSAGIVPGIVMSEYYHNNVSKEKLVEGLAIAGMICNVVRTNASISGAEVGCQGEVGVACSGAAGMICYLKGGTSEHIEYASEIALEHHLGMTCDPVDGLVQIPCIERNAMAAEFAYTAAYYSLLTNAKHQVTLDDVINVMNETGKSLSSDYRETSVGGLAKLKRKICE